MVPTAIGSYYEARASAIRARYRRAARYFTEDDIHELRVEIKRLRALAKLLAWMEPSFRARKRLRHTRQLFKVAGTLRDLHVQRELVNAHVSSLPWNLSEYRNYLQSRETTARREYARAADAYSDDELARFTEAMLRALGGLEEGDIMWKTEQRLSVIVSRLADLRHEQDLALVDLHKIRIMSKEARYTLEILRAFPGPVRSEREALDSALRRVHRALGRWHDADVGVALVRQFLEQEADRPLQDEDAFETYQSRLGVERDTNLAHFHSRWQELLTRLSGDGPEGAGPRPPAPDPK